MKNKILIALTTLALAGPARAETCNGTVTQVMVNSQNGYVQVHLTNGIGWATLCSLKLSGEICKSIISLATGAQLSKQKLIIEYSGTCSALSSDGYGAIDKFNAIGVSQ